MNSDHRTLVIAEAGVNHNGDISTALELVDVAADAGADAIKFQTFRAESLVGKNAPKAEYQIREGGAAESHLEMLRRLELSERDHQRLLERARTLDIQFMSTPFDFGSLRFLTEGLGITTIKVPSGEITNAVLLLQIARSATNVIVSTGMSTLGEVETALGVLAFGFSSPVGSEPSPESFASAFSSKEGRSALLRRTTLLHCTTEYPAPVESVNLKAMDTMAAAFGLPVGFSDHTRGIHIAVAAVARGACVIEKHFTLDREMEGPDHRASLEPMELRQMVAAIRETEQALGSGIKVPSEAEWKNRTVARRSLVAARAIVEGEEFTAENLACKRPGDGRSPFEYWSICGKRASKNYLPDDLI